MFEKSRLLTYWSRLSLSYRGAVIVTIPALCLLATLVTWLWSRSEGLEIRARVENSQERIANTKELLVIMLNEETGVRGYLVTGDREFLEPNRLAQKTLPIALSNLQQSSGINSKQLAQLDSIRSRIQSIQTSIAELQTTFSAPTRTRLLKQGKREMDALRQEIDATQAIEQVTLDRELSNLNDLQSLIQSLQQLFTVTGIMSTVGGIYLFQLLERELRQREAQIQTRDSLIDTLTNNIIDGVIIIDRSGQIEAVNPALIEMFGYTAIDLLECPLMRLFIALSASKTQPLPSLLTWLEQQPKLGRIWQITAYHRNGTSLPIELSLSEIPQENRLIAIVRDVSEQAHVMKQSQIHLKAAEKLNLALISTNSTLNSRNQELAEFAYATAHDLKTPLRGITTLAEWIEEEIKPTNSSTQLLQHLQLLRQRTYRLNALINGLWEYSNLGQTPITPEPIDLLVFLQEIQSNFPLPAKFAIDIHPTNLHLTTCKSYLRQVIEELLENAVKHHDLDPTGDARGKIMISVRLKAGSLEFIIRDNGPGIPSASVSTI
jgi:PAS domain S-box-containing protein